MRVSLQKPRTKLFLLADATLVAVAYIALATTEFFASYFSDRPTAVNLKRAVRLQPGNAAYYYLQGRYFTLVQPSPQEALHSFRVAVGLNPHQARYWFALAGAHQLLGNTEEQKAAIEHAIAVDPSTPEVAWEAANFYVVQGDINKALQELRVVLANDPYLPASALPLCWRLKPDAEALLHDVVPPSPDIYSAFLEFLISKNEPTAAALVWRKLAQLQEPVSRRYVFEYVRYLIGQRQANQARSVWQQAANLADLAAYQPSSENLVINGDFSLDTLNDGFDWIYQQSPEVSLSLDSTQFHTGHHSLLITFDTRGIEDAGIRQLIPVKPNTSYTFSAYFKAENLEGAGGPRFVLQDAYTSKTWFSSDDFSNVDFWKQVNGTFTTGPDTELLVLRVQREPAGSPIKGRLWIDDMRLSPIRMQAGTP